MRHRFAIVPRILCVCLLLCPLPPGEAQSSSTGCFNWASQGPFNVIDLMSAPNVPGSLTTGALSSVVLDGDMAYVGAVRVSMESLGERANLAMNTFSCDRSTAVCGKH